MCSLLILFYFFVLECLKNTAHTQQRLQPIENKQLNMAEEPTLVAPGIHSKTMDLHHGAKDLEHSIADTNTSGTETRIVHNDKVTDDQPSLAPLLPCTDVGSAQLNVPSYILSDNASMVSVEEIHTRREELKLYSKEQSLLWSSSPSLVPDITAKSSILSLNNNNIVITCDRSPFSSVTSSLSSLCRICQCPAEPDRVLIAPCRCKGSLQYIHSACLLVSIQMQSNNF